MNNYQTITDSVSVAETARPISFFRGDTIDRRSGAEVDFFIYSRVDVVLASTFDAACGATGRAEGYA